jgi:R3H domain
MSSESTPSQAAANTQSVVAAGTTTAGGRGSRRRRKRNGASSRANRIIHGSSLPVAQNDDSSQLGAALASGQNQNLMEDGNEPALQANTTTANQKDRRGAVAVNPNVSPSLPKKKNKKRKSRQKPGTLWKKHLPEDSVDPITLDPLSSLRYPPFALVAEEPYLPIGWPLDKSEDDLSKESTSTETEEVRQARILREQWGVVLNSPEPNVASQPTENIRPPSSNNSKERHVNLFDGRALAYYMVSQLQFIDPLNRRDLTRDEIVHLDQYLRRHKFFDLNVTEAYDAKGITVSTAGATAQTARGRATILQEEARHLLNALFGSRRDNLPTAPTNSFARDYQEHEASQVRRRSPPRSTTRRSPPNVAEDTGVYGAGTAYVVIDDDINPGLRAGDSNYVHQPHPESRLRASADLFSPGHARETMFPALDAMNRTENVEESKPPPAASLPKTKTLSKIISVVQKTDPMEQQRQWEAREAAIRKAALVNRSFSSANPVGTIGPSMPTVVSAFTTLEPTDGQIERNKAIADALGVQPTTLRANLRSGWARPLDGTDEFGNELAVTIYPDSLILEARNLKPGLLTKIERKWKIFLSDDSSSSLSLTPMDRPTRKTIHEYSDFWKLQTQSYDPEPQRYIHCVKVVSTRAPKPLLSEILHLPLHQSVRIHQSEVGQLSGREMPQPPIRIPLALQPRSDEGKIPASSSSTGMSLNGQPRLSMSDTTTASRFDTLLEGRERPKLELAKRTLPVELPAFQPKKATDEMVERLRAKAKRAILLQETMEHRTKKAIEAAFASDDESDASSSSTEWAEQVPAFVVSDEEES